MEEIYYVVKVNGVVVSEQFSNKTLAENAKLALLKESNNATATNTTVVPITATGQEVLLG